MRAWPSSRSRRWSSIWPQAAAGEHPKAFLGAWRGTLVCDDYAGYKALFGPHIAEAGCLAHAQRKFHELHASGKSSLAERALQLIGQLYEIEREVKDSDPDERRRMRQSRARPIADDLHAWSGSSRSGTKCPMVRPPPARPTTASSAGGR
jgi:hypothetical protein